MNYDSLSISLNQMSYNSGLYSVPREIDYYFQKPMFGHDSLNYSQELSLLLPIVISEKFSNIREPIEEVIGRIAKEVPEQEWDKIPLDWAEKLDFYIYEYNAQ